MPWENAPAARCLSRDDAAIMLGLACFFASMIIYSTTVSPFQRFPHLSDFIGHFAPAMLASAFLCSAAVAVAGMRGVFLPVRAKRVAGGALYALGAAAFVAMALFGAAGHPLALSVAVGFAHAAGCVLLALVWGGACSRFGLRKAIVVMGGAALCAVALRAVQNALPIVPSVVAYAAFVAGAVLLPPREEAVQEPGAEDASFQALLEVSAVPALGLALFAFIMGAMRFLYSQLFDTYLVAMAVAVLLLAVCAANRWRVPFLHLAAQRVVLLLSVVVLAATSVSYALTGSAGSADFLVLVLYSFTAVLSLSMICAVAHAAEFPSDFVFSSTVALFACCSLAGLMSAELIGDARVPVVMVAATSAYAVLLVAFLRLGVVEEAPEALAAVVGVEAGEGVRTEAEPDAAAPSRDVCSELADAHGLTPRELEILRFLARGHSGAYIAEALFISPNTARTHIHNIYRKLDASSREDILRLTHE